MKLIDVAPAARVTIAASMCVVAGSANAQLAYPCQRLVLRLDTVLLKVWTIELPASRFGKRLNEARWGAYPNEILLWRIPLESAEVRLRLGRALKDVRRDAAPFQRFA